MAGKTPKFTKRELAAYEEWGWYKIEGEWIRYPGCEYYDDGRGSDMCVCSGAYCKEDMPDFCPYSTCPLEAERIIGILGEYEEKD